MICPHCKKPITTSAIAAHLGKMGAGKPKNYSAAERLRRRERMAKARNLRHKKGGDNDE